MAKDENRGMRGSERKKDERDVNIQRLFYISLTLQSGYNCICKMLHLKNEEFVSELKYMKIFEGILIRDLCPCACWLVCWEIPSSTIYRQAADKAILLHSPDDQK